MRNAELLAQLFEGAHGILDRTMADCSDELAARRIEGARIGSIAAIYAHLTFAEDILVNRSARGTATVFEAGGWGTRTGIELPAGPTMDEEWASGVRYEPGPFREYAAAVHAATLDYLRSVSDEELAGMARVISSDMPRAMILGRIALYHVAEHTGEIAALKGVQGHQGLPF